MKIINQLRFRHPKESFVDKGRLAVIDIGSSSIRLVVYDDVRRYPYMVLNQKVWAVLAEGKTMGAFHLQPEKIQQAKIALGWFKWLATEADCEHLVVVATSAVREAENQNEFIKAAAEVLGGTIHILSGEEEAQLSSLGAVASIPDARGVVIDLGGGSLELSETSLKNFSSLPMGVQVLKNMSGGNPEKAVEILEKELAKIPWLDNVPGGDLVAIGSGMRSIARLHMVSTNYPLDIIHDYKLDKQECMAFCQQLMAGDISADLADLSEQFKSVLPYRAAALYVLLKLDVAQCVRFATFGLREGLLFSQLVACPVLDDPLKAFATEQAKRQGKGLAYSKALASWCKNVMPNTPERFIDVASLFSETGWRAHPLYRAQSHYNRVLGGAYVGASHLERLKLALSAYYGHGMMRLTPEMNHQKERLLTEHDHVECQTLGALFQLAQVLDPGAKGHLDQFQLVRKNGEGYSLNGPKEVMALTSEELQKLVQKASDMLKIYSKKSL